jgi:hypothetical protein
MMKMVGVTSVTAAMLLLAAPSGFGKTVVAPKSASGSIVIVFKDGHRQSYNLSDIDRVEFSGALSANDANSPVGSVPGRGHFLGKWEVGDGSGNNFFITLREDGTALRSMGDMPGKWIYVDGEARVTWEDGAQDAIRKVASRYMKFAYGAGKSFSDSPDNVAGARNTTPRPI